MIFGYPQGSKPFPIRRTLALILGAAAALGYVYPAAVQVSQKLVVIEGKTMDYGHNMIGGIYGKYHLVN